MAMIVNGRGYVGIGRSNPNRPSIVTDGLKLYLDAGQTTSYPGTGTVWTDISGNGNNGTLTNGPTFNGANGGSIVFDGSNDYGTISYTLTAPFTVTLWFKQTTLLSRGILETIDSGVQNNVPNLLIVAGSGILKTYSNNNGYKTVGTDLALNTWYSITVTRTLSSETTYLNGNLIFSNSPATGPITSKINIGVGYGGYFKGNLSNIQVYNRILTSTEVTQNYNALKGRFGL